MSKYNLDEPISSKHSIELLKELHILTRDGKLNQDSRRKVKQVNHLVQFIESLIPNNSSDLNIVDHGAGKSYLGFILYDLLLSKIPHSQMFGVETRGELIQKSTELAKKLGFDRMHFVHSSVQDSQNTNAIPSKVEIVTALHACDTATDDAIDFALQKRADHLVLVPCCQAEIASLLRANKNAQIKRNFLSEIYRHPLHTREFGSLLTNVLRCLYLESKGYQVTVTELIGWEHSMKNELIIATQKNLNGHKAAQRLDELLNEFNLKKMLPRYDS